MTLAKWIFPGAERGREQPAGAGDRIRSKAAKLPATSPQVEVPMILMGGSLQPVLVSNE